MATRVYNNAYFLLNATDLSASVASLGLNASSEMLDETAMGDATRIRKGGMKDWSIDVTFHQDFAAGSVDATLFPLIGTTACVEIRSCNACTSAGNPRFQGIAVLETYPPMSGGVGDLLNAAVRFQPASDLSRSVTVT